MSKNTYLILAMLSLFAAGLTFYYGSTNESASLGSSATTTTLSSQYIANDLGVAFDYTTGEEGYNLTQPNTEQVPGLEKLIVLSKVEDLATSNVAGIPLESPPTITVAVYQNQKQEQPRSWADNHKMYSNIELRLGDPAEFAIGGYDAIRYTTDGLYRTDNVIISHEGHIYMFSGAYLEEDSEIHKDFLELLGTIEFIPTKDQT